MSFHLDLEHTADCDRWRELLRHEAKVERQSVGALAGTYGTLPPTVLSSFLTHRHTHRSLLNPAAQAELARAEADGFSFERNPSRENYMRGRNLDAAGLHAMTHQSYAEARAATAGEEATRTLGDKHHHAYIASLYPSQTRSHLPTHVALAYLHPPQDGSNSARLSLYPRAAQSYARGTYTPRNLLTEGCTTDPHPSWRQHAETSTFRRTMTGRRHAPFPRRIQASCGGGGNYAEQTQQLQYFEQPSPLQEESKSNDSPSMMQQQQPPASNQRSQPQPQLLQPHPPPPPAAAASRFVPRPPSSSSSSSQQRQQQQQPPLQSQQYSQPSSARSSLPPVVPSAALPPSSTAAAAAAPMHPGMRGNDMRRIVEMSVDHPARAGFAGDAARNRRFDAAAAAPAGQHPSSALETNRNFASLAERSHDHRNSFGRGAFTAVPQQKLDQGLHASHRHLW